MQAKKIVLNINKSQIEPNQQKNAVGVVEYPFKDKDIRANPEETILDPIA